MGWCNSHNVASLYDLQSCNDDPVHAWDEAVAFYTGSIPKSTRTGGVLLYSLAQKRCQEFHFGSFYYQIDKDDQKEPKEDPNCNTSFHQPVQLIKQKANQEDIYEINPGELEKAYFK